MPANQRGPHHDSRFFVTALQISCSPTSPAKRARYHESAAARNLRWLRRSGFRTAGFQPAGGPVPWTRNPAVLAAAANLNAGSHGFAGTRRLLRAMSARPRIFAIRCELLSSRLALMLTCAVFSLVPSAFTASGAGSRARRELPLSAIGHPSFPSVTPCSATLSSASPDCASITTLTPLFTKILQTPSANSFPRTNFRKTGGEGGLAAHAARLNWQ